MRQPFGRQVQELGVSKANVVQNAIAVVAHPSLGANAPLPQLIALVFHQGHKRRHHQAKSASGQGGQLKTSFFLRRWATRPPRGCLGPNPRPGRLGGGVGLRNPNASEAGTADAPGGLGKFLAMTCGEDGRDADFWPPIERTKVMRNVVAGNWKSNKLLNDARAWMDGMSGWLAKNRGVDVMVAMPAPYLAACAPEAPEGFMCLPKT